MNELTAILLRMTVIILIIVVGALVRIFKLIPEDADKGLSTLVIYIANPALIFNSVMSNGMNLSRIETLKYVGISFAFYIIMGVMAKVLGLIPVYGKIPKKHVEAMLVFTNMGFIGLPVIQSIYGNGAIFYVALMGIPFNIMVYTYGIYLLRKNTGKIKLRNLINPSSITAVVVLFFYFCEIPIPSFIMDFTSMLGAVTVPLALMIVGFNLAKEPILSIVTDIKVYLFIFVKLVVFPFVIWLLFRPVISDKVLLGVMVIIAAMPVGSNVSMINREYGDEKDSACIAKCTVLSTVLSVIAIPLWSMILV